MQGVRADREIASEIASGREIASETASGREIASETASAPASAEATAEPFYYTPGGMPLPGSMPHTQSDMAGGAPTLTLTLTLTLTGSNLTQLRLRNPHALDFRPLPDSPLTSHPSPFTPQHP